MAVASALVITALCTFTLTFGIVAPPEPDTTRGWRQRVLRYKTRPTPGRESSQGQFHVRWWQQWHPRQQSNDRGWHIHLRRLNMALKCQSLPRAYGGFCNNIWNPRWGTANYPMLVLAGAPRSRAPTGLNLPNPRALSNIIAAAGSSIPNRRGLSELVMFFGQFVDHTVTRTRTISEQMPIRIPMDDKRFPPGSVLPFSRTDRRWTKTPYADGFAPLNELSSFVDASSIYGVSVKEANGLRAWRGGLLRTSSFNLLPRKRNGFFLSGDSRVSENPGLASIHTLFFREHNRVAAEAAAAFPSYNDAQLYDLARRVVVAQLQAAVFYDFVPAMLGHPLPEYKRYESGTDATIATEFSTVGFRVGHSLINPVLTIVDKAGKRSSVPLRRAFFNPILLRSSKEFDDYLRGMLKTQAAEVDAHVTDDVRNFLLGEEGHTQRLDLFALNVQRGRDQAVLGYNDMRDLYGLPRVTKFDEITKDAGVASALKTAYKGDVNNIDAWVGGLAEDHVSGGSLGAVFSRIWTEQFLRLRDGDRFYFRRPGAFSEEERTKLPTIGFLTHPSFKGGAMRRLLLQNSGLTEGDVSNDPFFV